MKPDPKIRATARPMRVAYVLEDGAGSGLWLDAVFAHCFGRHGGRQSLVVPVVGATISATYSRWLQFLDPDIAVLIAHDNEAVANALARVLPDATFVAQRRALEDPEPPPRVHLELAGLTALSVLPLLKVASGFARAAPHSILDAYRPWQDDGIISDNFGTLQSSLDRFPMHDAIGLAAHMLTPRDAPANRWNLQVRAVAEYFDGYDAVEGLAHDAGVATLAQLSNLFSQPHRPKHPWAESFCVIVGDTFEDRLSCWNAGLLFEDAQSQLIHTLRVPSVATSDPRKVAQVGRFLARRNWVNQQNGPAHVAVRSHSLGLAVLQDIALHLRHASMSVVDAAAIGSLDDCCPADTSRIYASYRYGASPLVVAETPVLEGTTVVKLPRLKHLEYCAGQHPAFEEGLTFAELSIDKLQDHGAYDNVREVWRLPTRAGLPRLFCGEHGARVDRHGRIALPVTRDHPAVEFHHPSDEEIIRRLLIDPPYARAGDLRAGRPMASAYVWAEPSDKGHYLRGTLGLFGSLNGAARTLGTHFWRRRFLGMAAPSLDQTQEVVTALKRRLARDGHLVVDGDDAWTRLAHRAIQTCSRLRAPRTKTKFKQLHDAWITELSMAIDRSGDLMGHREVVLAGAHGELERSLSFLLDRGVFYRGHEWGCRHCSHRNWVRVNDLQDSLQCEVCGKDHQLPVDVALDFQLNGFLATCLREHDTLTVVWALSSLRDWSDGSFTFAPQMALYRDTPDDVPQVVHRELDVVCVAKGKFIVGEAKLRVELITPSDIEDLAQAAADVRADVALLMALTGGPDGLDEKVRQLRAKLPPHVEALGFVSDWNDEPSDSL